MAHTHWDREWYHSAAHFRQRLVALVDALLANSTGATAPFLLDGQAIVLEDYLAVRPDRAEHLGLLLRAGALEAGPWYVLADGLIPSGEAVVRNLLAGRSVLQRFGNDVGSPAVAYCPDTFGHASAIPAIAAGFGFQMAIAWRGYGSARAPHGDVVRWHSDDGSAVLLHHLPPDGYETGSSLPVDVETLRVKWHALRVLYAQRSNTGVVLLPNGADHHALQAELSTALRNLQLIAREQINLEEAGQPDVITRMSLQQFAEHVVEAARNIELPVVHGELRDSYGYTWTLGGTYGTRAYQKRANARAERALLRDVEPWLLLASLHGRARDFEVSNDASISLAQAPALLNAAWRTLLRAHPHDTMCGCSIDAVARSMDEHVSSARAQARGLRVAALDIVLQHDAVLARSRPLANVPSVVVRNRVARWRGGVAEVLLDETLADVPVGPSSAVLSGAVTNTTGEARTPIIGELVVQVVSSRLVYRRRESPQHYPDNDLVCEHRALVWMPELPPLGLVARAFGFTTPSIAVPPIELEARAIGFTTPAIAVPPIELEARAIGFTTPPIIAQDTLTENLPRTMDQETDCNSPDSLNKSNDAPFTNATSGGRPFQRAIANQTHGGIELANGRLRVFVSNAGARMEMGDRVIENVLTFETHSDIGDSYTPAIRGEPELLQVVRIAMGATGPLRASAKLWLRTPGKRDSVQVQATLSLDAESDIARVDIRGNNGRRDHRLRVNFSSDVATRATMPPIDVWADAAFGPVLRPPLNVPELDQQFEMVPPTMPMHRWATLSAADRGATLHSDGLAEVEPNRVTGTLSLTLLRAIGELSRSNLRERPGHAGWPAPIPMAQSQGAFRAQIGLQLHGTWSQQTRDVIEDASDKFLLPLTGGTMRDLDQPRLEVAGPLLTGVGLRQSATKLADDGDGITLRCVNDSHESSNGSWTIPNGEAFEFADARLDETLTGTWEPVRERIEFTAPPRAIVTLRVRRLSL
ncbi:MAG: hypothetical protein ABJB74_22095 [Gemmatimonas sp.]